MKKSMMTLQTMMASGIKKIEDNGVYLVEESYKHQTCIFGNYVADFSRISN